jgi:hypothetical protein
MPEQRDYLGDIEERLLEAAERQASPSDHDARSAAPLTTDELERRSGLPRHDLRALVRAGVLPRPRLEQRATNGDRCLWDARCADLIERARAARKDLDESYT